MAINTLPTSYRLGGLRLDVLRRGRLMCSTTWFLRNVISVFISGIVGGHDRFSDKRMCFSNSPISGIQKATEWHRYMRTIENHVTAAPAGNLEIIFLQWVWFCLSVVQKSSDTNFVFLMKSCIWKVLFRVENRKSHINSHQFLCPIH